MAPSSFHTLFAIHPSSSNKTSKSKDTNHPKSPSAFYPRRPPPSKQIHPAIELSSYPSSARQNDSSTPLELEPVVPQTPNELEMSRPPSPKQDEAAGLVQTWRNPPINRWRVLSCCLIYFCNGLIDSGRFEFSYHPKFRPHRSRTTRLVRHEEKKLLRLDQQKLSLTVSD